MNRQALQNIFFSLVLTGMFTVLVFNVFRLPFAVGDDHRIIAMNHPEKMEPAYIQTLHNNDPGLTGTLMNDARLGRFRPLGWTFTKIQSLVFHDNAGAWRGFNILILFFSLLTFAGICRQLRIHSAAVFVMMLVYVFGRNNETWWTLIPPAQNIGELFLLAGFLAWLHFRGGNKIFYKFLSLILLLSSALVKESFIFCIPFVWLADFFFFSKQKRLFVKEYFLLSLVFLVPFAGLVITILSAKTIYSYAYPDSLVSILIYNAGEFFISSVFLLAPLVMFIKRNHIISRRNLVKLFIFMLCWLLIQLVLLKGIKMNDQHHYLIPGLLPVLVISALALHFLKKKSFRLFSLLFAVYLLFGLWQAKNTFVNSGYYAAQVKSYYKMIDAIESNKPERIYYLSPGPVAGDWLMGTSAILRNKNIDAPLIFCSTTDSVSGWERKFLDTRPAMKFPSSQYKPADFRRGDWLINVEQPKVSVAGESAYVLNLPGIPDSLTAKKISGLEENYVNITLREIPSVKQKKIIEYEAIELK